MGFWLLLPPTSAPGAPHYVMTGKQLLAELLLLVAMTGGHVFSGYAPHYSPHLMAKVAHRRHIAPATPSECIVSSPRYPLRTQLYVYGVNTGILKKCLVVDVSADRDRPRHLRTGREVELSWELTPVFCGPEGRRSRPEACPVIVIKLGD